MNHRLGAAIAALAVISAPVLASANGPSWALVTGWNGGDHNVSGLDHLWTNIQLHHDGATVHQPVAGHIGDYAPPCRSIAIRWDITVWKEQFHPTHDYTSKFEKLLNKMADKQCKIFFVGGGTNTDGSTNLTEVSPTP